MNKQKFGFSFMLKMNVLFAMQKNMEVDIIHGPGFLARN